MKQPYFAFGVGAVNYSASGKPLDYWFPICGNSVEHEEIELVLNTFFKEAESGSFEITDKENFLKIFKLSSERFASLAPILETLFNGNTKVVVAAFKYDSEIKSSAEAYLKLHLLSNRLCLPNSINLSGIFSHLPTLAWTSEGSCLPEDMPMLIASRRAQGRHLDVFGVDKFPRMTDYVVPDGVRIADSSRIRLGAYLGPGTTVMHEGFVNFNAGTLGTAMIEGRISQGVTVGDGSDLGGSASTMGTLSGGGKQKISIGENCLIGANAGTGISLGDRCTIEAGLYITAGTKVNLIENKGKVPETLKKTVKARDLSGNSDLVFIRNSVSGEVEVRKNMESISLNADLHANN